MLPAFHFDILKEFLPIMHEKTTILLEKLKEETTKEYSDIHSAISLCALDITCETIMGVDAKIQENGAPEYVKARDKVSDFIFQRLIRPWIWSDFIFSLFADKETKENFRQMRNFSKLVIQEKKKLLLAQSSEKSGKNRPTSLLQSLLEHHLQREDFTEDDIQEEVDTFIFAGHDTVAQSLHFTLYLIGLYKDVQQKIVQELDDIFGCDTDRPITADDLRDMKYLECVIKESLRLYPPVPFFAKQADEDIVLSGYPISKQTPIIFPVSCLHRNENCFPNPEIFDPNRFMPENAINRHPFVYLPFSVGSRSCLGQRLAIMEEKFIIATILKKYTLHSLSSRDKVITQMGIVLQSVAPLHMKIRLRHGTKEQ